MPHIKPFFGIYPAQEYIEHVLAAPPDFPLNEAARVTLAANPCSFLHLVAPPLNNEFLQGSHEELVYRQAAENLQTFLEKGILQKDQVPCLYLYTVQSGQSLQTGIWTVTLFDDYLNNRVRKHEYTRIERETSITEYIRRTGIDANPVLIAYPEHQEIDRLATRYLRQEPFLSFSKDGKRHSLRKIDSEADIEMLVRYFRELPAAYLADGHHRAAALSSYGVERRKFNFRHTGREEYNFFSSVYFSAASLEIKPFNRLVKDLNGLSPADFLEKLALDLVVRETPGPPSTEPGRFGMYLSGQWYLLQPREAPGKETEYDPVKDLDVTLLQDQVLGPLLNIDDPRTDKRLRFEGGTLSPEGLAREVDEMRAAVLFILYPTTISQLMAVADAGLVMPPKSTWFEPKLDLGMLTHYID